ncbi:MAG: hypothetical protein KDA56_09580 [Hyphomonas sp.]|nr:hypothetical protein [Hyphomonas sp.]
MTPSCNPRHATALALGAVCLASCAPPVDVEATAGPANFDSCLITHMAAIAMLEEASDGTHTSLLGALIDSQRELLSDDTIEEDDLAARTSTLMRAYSGAADAAIAEAEARGTTPQALATEAMACGKALAA